jgi:formylglycine-generating enzyme required for sulfatase activity
MTAARLVRMAVLLGASTGCSRVLPGGGLVVVLRSDPSLDPQPDGLNVEVGPADGGAAYLPGRDYALGGGPYSLPVTFAVDSNGDPGASVAFAVAVSTASQRWPTETLHFEVDAIPSDWVAELDVPFRAACLPGANARSGSGEYCCPTVAGACRWDGDACVCSGLELPAFPAGGTETVPDPPDSASDGAPDATLDADAAGDAAGDVTIETSGDGQDASLDSAGCEAGAVQCAGSSTPQRCGPDGQWQDQTPCQSGVAYCSAGACLPIPRSCVGTGISDCSSDEVPAGTFLRGNDSMNRDAGALASISAFRLDTYEVEVARFRGFVRAVEEGVGLPDAGDGKHTHLAHGGLNGGGDGGVPETGWDPAWNVYFPTDSATWNSNLSCANTATWSAIPAQNDWLPIDCVTWYEAYAFCIWDGAFLPTEAEWNYAAAGGSEQRLYPWGAQDPGTQSQYADYGCLYPQLTMCNAPSAINVAPVDSFPMGTGAFGQRQLAGNVLEWTLDLYDPNYPTPCDDCAGLSGTERVYRGGAFDRPEPYLYTSKRINADPTVRSRDVGVRCARTP